VGGFILTTQILETLLSRMGCRCVCVRDGPDALAVTGNLKFDVIFLDMHMPFVSGEQVARMIRSTTNPNQNSPIIAATAYDEAITEQGTLFSAVMGKPFSKTELIRCLSKVGFIIGSTHGHESATVAI
jgi:serine/threonine-protein kinase RIM15